MILIKNSLLVFWNMLKIPYFQRKHKEKYNFPLVIETFLLYLQRILIKQVPS